MYGWSNSSGSKWQPVLYQWPANTWGNVPAHQMRKRVKNECAWARRTATSHPVTCTTKVWVVLTRWTASSHVIQSTAVHGKNLYWPLRLCPGPQHDHSHFLVTAKLTRTLCPTWSSRKKRLCFLKIDRPHVQPIVWAQVGAGKSAIMTNGVKRDCNGHQFKTRSHALKGDAKCTKRIHNTDAESVVYKHPPWQKSTCPEAFH